MWNYTDLDRAADVVIGGLYRQDRGGGKSDQADGGERSQPANPEQHVISFSKRGAIWRRSPNGGA
jgi:hypothetical protein